MGFVTGLGTSCEGVADIQLLKQLGTITCYQITARKEEWLGYCLCLQFNSKQHMIKFSLVIVFIGDDCRISDRTTFIKNFHSVLHINVTA
jgi:hypothetical protein